MTALAGMALLASCAGLPGGTSPDPSAAPAAPAASAPPASTAAPSTAAPAAPASAPSVAPSASTDARAAVVPFLTSADWDAQAGRLDVSALVPKVIESGGTCTVVAERDGVSVERSGPGVATATYTGCQELSLRDDRLVPGTWQVHVTYSSDESAGVSAVRAVTVG